METYITRHVLGGDNFDNLYPQRKINKQVIWRPPSFSHSPVTISDQFRFNVPEPASSPPLPANSLFRKFDPYLMERRRLSDSV